MKKKDLIFYAGAAVLMAVSAQGVSADELVSKEVATTEGNQVQAETAPEVATTEKSVAPVASNYTAPANVTEPAVVPVSKTTASESVTPSVEKTTEASTTEKEETPLPSDTGRTTFFNTGAHAPAGRSTDVAVQPKSFVDVSSHNGDISIGDYRTLANKGVGGVVVKLTEDTWYKNPNAENQIRNAQAAGLQVSTYHFSRYTSEEAARAEARFYIAAAQRLNLPKNTLMVNDFEDAKMQSNINRTTQAWADEMRKNGYTNLMFYTSASWLDENNLRKKGPVNTAQFGLQNFWVAQYPSPKLSVNDAKSLRYNGKAGAWQFTSQAELLPGKHLFDHSVDYTGRFTANAKPAADPTEGSLAQKTIVYKDKIGRDRHDRRKRLVDPRKGQYAETQVTQLKKIGRNSLIKCQLKTGRTHQIRVHLSHHGHPIVGDPLYNPARGERLMLHAHRLTFTNPLTLETIQVEAPSKSFEEGLKK